MRRVMLALAALWLWLPAFAQAAPSVRHAVAAKVCRAGSVRLGDGLCCPRSGVTRGGGCVSGALRPDVVPPPLAFCPGGRARDALGRCPAQACGLGYSRDRFGRCERNVACADGRLRNAFGKCPPVIATPRVSASKTCLGGQPPLVGGVCPPLFLCSNGYAPVAGRCSPGARLSLTRPRMHHAPAPLARPAIAPLTSPRLAAPQIHTAPALARPHFASPRLQPPALAQPHFARPIAPQLAAPHLAPVPLIHPMAPPALAAPHFAPPAPAPHFAPAAPAGAPHLL